MDLLIIFSNLDLRLDYLYLKCNFPMTGSVRPLVGWLVGQAGCWSVTSMLLSKHSFYPFQISTNEAQKSFL